MQYAMSALPGALGLVIALAAGAAVAQTMPGATVDSLLDLARANNPDYAAQRHDAAAAAERIGPAGALADPRLRIELQDVTMGGEQNPSLSPSRAGSTRYQIMQDLPWFGKRDLKRSIATQNADAAKAGAASAWQDIAARIKGAYAQSYYLFQNERLTQEILDLMSSLEKVAQARYASGLAAQQDVIRAQVELTTLSNELISLESDIRMNRVQLNMLLARPAYAPLAPPMQTLPQPVSARLDYALLEQRLRAGNPQLFAANAKLQAAELGRDLTLRNRYPDFTVGIAPVQSGRSVKNWELMVELNIPLQQSSRRSQEREAQSMLAAARSRKEATANQLLAELAGDLSGLEAARRVEHRVADSLIPQAQLTFNAALAGYENGKVDFATVLDAQRQIRMARQSRFKAQLDAAARLVEIERLLGETL
ncbi:TolC family protein [Duganella violaceipulchra]|uniref:Outer membrane protein TolC n=1 Tax=Duganella violaceipulchra TaxID=2849652 RepID=A0AA41H5L7_9BURK|nr:TolC family protein [Duganella violaceicalia]MBV6319385.1 TolC family protein [Duganella violaceicalia]MCP2006803.1 outer membrane protein TolC [Duganella violaceicalia]